MPRVFLTAAELSGDRHAAHLALALKRLRPDVELIGLGGAAMRSAGVHLLADTVDRAAMGLRALLRAREARGWLRLVRESYAAQKPDLHLCVDSWTINGRFAAIAKSAGVPVLYYVAPQTWASREGRVKKMRQVIDKLACILPFEEAYFRGHGLDATFVGHPLFDELPRERIASRRTRDPARRPVVALPAGSRRSVAAANFKRQVEVAEAIRRAIPDAVFRVPTVPATHAIVEHAIGSRDWISAELGAFDDVMHDADLAITVSGTATLHAAAWGVPMLIVYAGSPLLWHGVGRWIIKTRTFGLVNLLAGREVAREFIPWYGSVTPVVEAALSLLRDPDRLDASRQSLLELVASLDRVGASDAAASLACGMLDANSLRTE